MKSFATRPQELVIFFMERTIHDGFEKSNLTNKTEITYFKT